MSEQPEKCRDCGGSGEVEDDATGALGYVVKKRCPSCAGRSDMVKRIIEHMVKGRVQPASDLRFVDHHQPMVSPDFNVETMHPNDEPFWMIGSPYEMDSSNSPFLLDRAGMYALVEQCQKALARYYEKHPLSQEEVDVDQMRPGRPKARPPLRSPHAVQE